MPTNWIHLDLKGVMPQLDAFLRWIDLLADQGYRGVVLEYEDRLPWRTWPGTFRPGLTRAEWEQVWQRIRFRGMELVPLIQTLGHLEWLLKHDRYAAWRENGCWNEWCPHTPEVLPAIAQWLQEISDLHGPLQYLHIGGDETWNLASCPRCRASAEKSPNGKLQVYLDHLRRVLDLVAPYHVKPIIWADMFWRENRMDLVAQLPGDVILCDWQYSGAGPWPTTTQLAHAGHTIFGASSIRGSFDLSDCLCPLQPALDNVTGWRQIQTAPVVIHTLWARTRSLLPLYGPWEGWLPVFDVGAASDSLPRAALRPWLPRLDAAFSALASTPARALAAELSAQHFDDPWSEACRQWWILSLRWRAILLDATATGRTIQALQSVHAHIQAEPDYLNHRRLYRGRMLEEGRAWAQDVRTFFSAQQLTDIAEFLHSRLSLLDLALPTDWATPTVPFTAPRTTR